MSATRPIEYRLPEPASAAVLSTVEGAIRAAWGAGYRGIKPTGSVVFPEAVTARQGTAIASAINGAQDRGRADRAAASKQAKPAVNLTYDDKGRISRIEET